MKKEKKFNKSEMFSFAEHCMVKLLSIKPEDSEYAEISGYDVHRIKRIFYKFKKE